MHKHILLFVAPSIFAAAALAASSRDAEVLSQAQRSQLEFRQGNPAAAAPLVKMLEAAVAESPDNAELWEALGHARMSLQGSLFTSTSAPDMPRLLEVGERARDAYARSLALNANDPLVLGSHGMAQMVVSQLKGDGAGIMAGVEEMNAAVRQAPSSTATRLTRGFTIIHLPPQMRDTNAVIDDLQFIMGAAPGGRAEDVLHVMLGDVYAEIGKLAEARKEYAQVAGASAFAAEQVKRRAGRDAISPADIAAVRVGTATCAMCHAPGTDDSGSKN
jgi:hypothetical protein